MELLREEQSETLVQVMRLELVHDCKLQHMPSPKNVGLCKFFLTGTKIEQLRTDMKKVVKSPSMESNVMVGNLQ